MPARQVFLSRLDLYVILDRHHPSSSNSRPGGHPPATTSPKFSRSVPRVAQKLSCNTLRALLDRSFADRTTGSPSVHHQIPAPNQVRASYPKHPGAWAYAKSNRRIHQQQEGDFCIAHRTLTGWVRLRYNRWIFFTLSTPRFRNRATRNACISITLDHAVQNTVLGVPSERK